MTKYIFVIGGVVSSLGKGVVAACIGRLLESRGISVSIQKLDPYLNVDPGTMSPFEHGEVFVLEDGAETDLDLGTYERFIDKNLTQASNVTAGQIYQEVIKAERRGDFLGKTIQVIPHVTNTIKASITKVARVSQADVVIVEVGGTVGDIEGQPFLEAIRQMRKDVGRENVLYIHMTLLPRIQPTGEIKTKPTQHSTIQLRSIGIQPDVMVCRSDYPVGQDINAKIALFCDVEERAVIPLVTTSNIYDVPLTLEEAGLGQLIVERLGLTAAEPDLAEWRAMVERIRRPRERVSIGLVGKYVDLHDAYISVREALQHATLYHDLDVHIEWVDAEDLERGKAWPQLESVDGIVVPGGFGHRGIEGKIIAARYARENKIPYLGLCLGMQIMVIELARHALDSDEPNSTEFDPGTEHPVIDLLPEQRGISEMGGTMHLGAHPCRVVPGTLAAQAYGNEALGDEAVIYERRRHRFEVNPVYWDLLQEAGLIISGRSPDSELVDIAELADHPWMLGSQFHPEFKSRPNRPHPLFRAFIGAVKERVAGCEGTQREVVSGVLLDSQYIS